MDNDWFPRVRLQTAYTHKDKPMDKPKGRYRCVICRREWDGSQLVLDPQSITTRWTCGDHFCGANVTKMLAGDINKIGQTQDLHTLIKVILRKEPEEAATSQDPATIADEMILIARSCRAFRVKVEHGKSDPIVQLIYRMCEEIQTLRGRFTAEGRSILLLHDGTIGGGLHAAWMEDPSSQLVPENQVTYDLPESFARFCELWDRGPNHTLFQNINIKWDAEECRQGDGYDD
jgi:hypothetical protein